MARRGKVKYKDVVKKPHLQSKKGPKKIRPRKTYSLFKKDEENKRPKRNFNNDKPHERVNPKRQKLEEMEPEEEQISSEEEIGDLDHLLSTFTGTGKNKKSVAIESSSESESESETEEQTVLEKIKPAEEKSDHDSTSSGDESHVESEKDVDEDKISNSEEVDPHTEEIHVEPENEKWEDIDNSEDPFAKHIFHDLHDNMLESLQNASVISSCETWPVLGQLSIQIPKCNDIVNQEPSEFSIAEKKIYAPPGSVPERIQRTAKPSDLFIKSQIIGNLPKVNLKHCSDETFSPLQAEIFSVINNYQDFYFPGRTFSNSEEIRYVYCLHAVNHVLKTRTKVIHHNSKLSKKDDVPEEFRDQGLVRPKVLIVVPFKDAAYKTVRMIIDLILQEDKGNVMNKNRFEEDYTGNELILPKKNPKPEDYELIFQGNTSDDFKIGLTITKKSIKLYADFYSSDIIIASPLGLRTIIGAEGEPERDYDFLASIEVLIFDQTEIFLMQNWDHVIHIVNHLHLQPKDSHGTDFARVRTWSLNGWAKYYRHTMIFSSINSAEINAIFNKKCHNYAGKVKVINPIDFGTISQVVVQVPHVFHRFECKSAAEAVDARYQFFVDKILPQQREALMKQTMIFVPSYFDYVRLRNYFRKEDIGFVQICEYSKEAKIARARDMFFHGDAHFLLYTERYHFFNRKRIKGIRHLLFYQLPVFPHFYYEICNLMQEAYLNKKIGSSSNMTVTVIYSKYDVYQLSACVGTEKAAKMIQSDRKVHMMVTGSE
nr:digestive organ expansion factor homolog [Leptinotarsa decemlineata]